MMSKLSLVWPLLLLPGLVGAQGQSQPSQHLARGQACANYVATRQPFFGELHLHTQYSADAATLDTRNTPRDAYRFAKGEKVGLPPYVDTRTVQGPDIAPPMDGVASHSYCLPPQRCSFTATNTIQFPVGRALDFTAVTDHAEYLGETNICFFEGGATCTQHTDCDTGQVCPGANPLTGTSGRCVPRGYASPTCVLAREEVAKLRTGLGTTVFATRVAAEFPQRFPFCAEQVNGEQTCTLQAQNVWQQTIAAAEEANEPCTFTAFIGYEYTASPGMGQCSDTAGPCFDAADCHPGATCTANPGGANNLHRNIIFRNANVPKLPISYMEVPTGCGQGQDCGQYTGTSAYPTPAGTFSSQPGISPIALGSPKVMLEKLQAQCNATNHCDFLSNPHNSNFSGGAMFLLPESPAEAAIRSARERLVEIFQVKGSSECRFAAQYPNAWQPGAFQADELCDFENMSFGKLGGTYLTEPDATNVLPSNYVRNALKEGLQYQQRHGINPFQLGFVGGTDNHNGTPGATDAVQYARTAAHGDNSSVVSGQSLNETDFLGLETNGGGLTGVWAEENTRDSLFAALQRRETFTTSGTRLTVRLFGGTDFPEHMCRRGDFAAQGYAHGVPMGGTLSGPLAGATPRFAVAALMDPGWEGHAGTKLQRAQIIKGWVDAQGHTHEKVYDVAGRSDDDATVDLRTCRPRGRGAQELCAVWSDPDFQKDEHAFYYARILENPSCRWQQYYCHARRIDCSQPPNTTGDIASYTEFEYQQCCSDAVPRTVQQRAWTSPIWYTPSTGAQP